MRVIALLLAALPFSALAQQPCAPTPKYAPCEIVYELSAQEAQQHPNPYLTVELYAEIRSPEYKTYKMPAFWDGGRRMVIRFSPNETGEWTFRVTSNLKSVDGKIDKFTALDSDSLGFIRPANVHHWIHTEQRKPHLWMGDTCYRCAYIDRGLFETIVAKRAEQKFTHIRWLVLPRDEDAARAFPAPDQPNPEYFREIDARVAFMNGKGIFADLILGGDANSLVKLSPQRQQRERYLRYVVARYAAYRVTWQLVQEYEEYENAREFAREMGLKLKELDPYGHPRTTHTLNSASAAYDDGWMNYLLYQSSDDALGAIEHQIYAAPQVNAEFGYEDSGAGKSHAHHVDSDTFRKRLWNATMNGQYPTFGNTGVYGGRKFEPAARWLDSPGVKVMSAWFDFFANTRYWELEPYFDLDGGRAVALPDVEYIVYVEKPGPVEVMVQKRTYQVYWFNPATGESIKEKKDLKEHVFKGSPPTSDRDWVLHLSRDGRKQGMLRSYKFESRRILLQDPELNPRNMPFELVTPKQGDTLPVGAPIPFEIKLKRETPGTRRMMYLIKGEVATGGQGFRYLGSGASGTLRIPPSILKQGSSTLTLRVHALNAPGKLYSLDYIFTVTKAEATQ